MPGRRPARLVQTHAPNDYISSGSGRRQLVRVEIETLAKRKPEAFITGEQVRAIQAKEWLTLKEAALLLNVSPLTLRRWTLAGKMRSEKVGRKHAFNRRDLFL